MGISDFTIQLPKSHEHAVHAKSPNENVRLAPFSSDSTNPPSSNTSRVTSKKSRCCGSRFSASRWGIPEKRGSKRSLFSFRKPPYFTYVFPGLAGSASKNRRLSNRSGETSTIASFFFRSKFQNAPEDEAPPGNRQPMPTIAIDLIFIPLDLPKFQYSLLPFQLGCV